MVCSHVSVLMGCEVIHNVSIEIVTWAVLVPNHGCVSAPPATVASLDEQIIHNKNAQTSITTSSISTSNIHSYHFLALDTLDGNGWYFDHPMIP